MAKIRYPSNIPQDEFVTAYLIALYMATDPERQWARNYEDWFAWDGAGWQVRWHSHKRTRILRK